MENAEEIFHFLEEFSKRKPKTIPQELNDYLAYVARTGDPVYQWSLVKSLFKEKLLNVITDFYETSPGIDIPPYPNVDTFNYDVMKNSLLERLDSFTSAPFTVQRICELLTYPRKQYNRIDKYMRAIEKNILVVSTREPGPQRHIEAENGDAAEPIVNGSDNNSDYNVDVEMEDMSWKDSSNSQQSSEPQPGSSDAHISADDIEARLQAKKDNQSEGENKKSTQYESVTPPELNMSIDEQTVTNQNDTIQETTAMQLNSENDKNDTSNTIHCNEPKSDVDVKSTTTSTTTIMVIPEIKVDDSEMTEKRLLEEASTKPEDSSDQLSTSVNKDVANPEIQSSVDAQQMSSDESSSDSNIKDEPDPKPASEISNVSEESSSSSDNTDGNSSSPRTDSDQVDTQDETNQQDMNTKSDQNEPHDKESSDIPTESGDGPPPVIESDHYSISDVNSELPQTPKIPNNVIPAADESNENHNTEQESTPIEKEEPKVNEDKLNDVVTSSS